MGVAATMVEFGGYKTPTCRVALSNDGKTLYLNEVNSTCKKLTNSKGVKIICNSNKSVCKTNDELMRFVIGNQSSNQKDTISEHVKITNFSNPADEPKGLYIVDLEVGNQSKTYRLYCPKKMVRDITNNTYGKSRSIKDEDSITFAGKDVLRKAYNKICVNTVEHKPKTTQKTAVPVVVRQKTIGSIRGISKNGDGFIAVRSGAGGSYDRIDKFYRNGEKVIISDRKGKWKGLIYGSENCGTDLSKKKGKVYEGACKTGWVFGKYVQAESTYSQSTKKRTIKPLTKQSNIYV